LIAASITGNAWADGFVGYVAGMAIVIPLLWIYYRSRR
jgi:hypothetical protein